MIIRPYKNGSQSAHELKLALTVKGIRCIITQKPLRRQASIINWGGTPGYDQRTYRKVFNPDTSRLVNKLTFFQHIGNDGGLQWTVDRDTASGWKKVMCRTKLTGHSGEGIVVWDSEMKKENLTISPLYVRYQPKEAEYRVHTGLTRDRGGVELIFCQRKVFAKRDGMAAPRSWDVRNLDNGFIFQNHEPQAELVQFVSDFHLKHFSGLDFCAWDVLYNRGRYYILEGNTAPGLEPRTAQMYANYFEKVM